MPLKCVTRRMNILSTMISANPPFVARRMGHENITDDLAGIIFVQLFQYMRTKILSAPIIKRASQSATLYDKKGENDYEWK